MVWVINLKVARINNCPSLQGEVEVALAVLSGRSLSGLVPGLGLYKSVLAGRLPQG